MVYNGNDKGRTKHIDIRFHYIREMIANNQVSVTYLNTEDMISDMLTKPLETKIFLKHRDNLLGNHHSFSKEILHKAPNVEEIKVAFFANVHQYFKRFNRRNNKYKSTPPPPP